MWWCQIFARKCIGQMFGNVMQVVYLYDDISRLYQIIEDNSMFGMVTVKFKVERITIIIKNLVKEFVKYVFFLNMYNTREVIGKRVSNGINQILIIAIRMVAVNAVAKFHRNMKRKKKLLLVRDTSVSELHR